MSLFLSMGTTSYANETYAVTYVYDGDTVELSNFNGNFKLRLTDIDAPELNQTYGKKSRRALMNLCKGSNIAVSVRILGTDKYNRTLGRLQCNHTDASVYLVEHGYAWHYAQYSHDPVIQHAAFLARQQKLGLWKNKNPTPPWVWRQKHPYSAL